MSAAWNEVKSWDFKAMCADVSDKTAPTTDGSVTVGSTGCDICTGTFDGLAFQGAGSWLLRTPDKGLYNGNGGPRMIAVLDLKADDKVVIAANAIDVFSDVANGVEDSSDSENKTITYKVTADGAFGVKMARYNYLYTITVLRFEQEAGDVMVDYVINYTYDGEVIKSDSVENVVAGTVVDAKEPLTVDDQKYYFADGATTSMTLAADQENVLDVAMRKAEVYSYSISNNVNDDVVTGDAVEGETVAVPYCRYILKEGTLYLKDATNKEYNYSFTAAPDYKGELVYSKTDITDALFYAEGENLEGMTYTNSANANVRCSNAAGGYADEAVVVTTLAPGEYTVTVGVWGNDGNEFVVKAGDVTVLTTETQGWWFETTSDKFVLTAESTDITFEGANSSKPLDYIYITGTVGTSAISSVAADAAAADVWYNLQGIRVNEPTQSGLYIHNGEKVYIRK